MSNLKKTMSIIVATVALLAGGNAQAQIPVTDAAAISTSIANHVEDIAKYVEQIAQLKAQLDQAKQLFDSMNGARGMASILNNPSGREYLPKDSAQIYSLVTSSGGAFSSLTGSAKGIKDAGAMLKAIDTKSPQSADMLNRAQNQLANQQATYEAAYNQAGQRFTKLQELVDTVDLANDPKAAADLQNRIAAEQTMLQNEQAKLAMLYQLHQTQQQQLKQQQRELAAKTGRGTPVHVTGY